MNHTVTLEVHNKKKYTKICLLRQYRRISFGRLHLQEHLIFNMCIYILQNTRNETAHMYMKSGNVKIHRLIGEIVNKLTFRILFCAAYRAIESHQLTRIPLQANVQNVDLMEGTKKMHTHTKNGGETYCLECLSYKFRSQTEVEMKIFSKLDFSFCFFFCIREWFFNRFFGFCVPNRNWNRYGMRLHKQ